MSLNTTTQLGGPVNVVYQRKLLMDARQRCVHFVGSRPGDVLSSHNGSFTVRWRRYNNISPTTSALSELVSGGPSFPTRAGSAVSKTDIDATVAKYGDHMFLTEEADLINFNNQGAALVEVFAVQAGRSLNRLQRNLLEDGAALRYAGGGATDATVADGMNLALIRAEVNRIARNSGVKFMPALSGSLNVGTTPVRESFWGLCHVDVEEDIRDLNGFKGVQTYMSQTETKMGEFGEVGGVRWISTEEASVDTDLGGDPGGQVRSTTGANADLYTSIIMAENSHGALSLDTDLIRTTYMAGDEIPGIIVISHPRGSAGVADPLNELASHGWKSWYAGSLIGPGSANSDWIGGIRTGARRLV